jgi:hypothetical protein
MHVRQLPHWQQGTLCIRPERIRLGLHEPPANGVRVHVRESIYRGDHMDVWVERAGGGGPETLLRVRTAPGAAAAAGESLWAQLPPESLEALVD